MAKVCLTVKQTCWTGIVI